LARLGCGAAAVGQTSDAEHADLAVERKRDDGSDPDLLAAFLDAPAVDPDVTGFNHRLGKGAAFDQPDEE
jgi:hypothetical protein